MLKQAHRVLYPTARYISELERYIQLYLHKIGKKNPKISATLKTYFSLGKVIIFSLVVVALCFALDIHIEKETLSFLRNELFFKPLNVIVPFLLATAMFAVPQRIPMETLATIGMSVIVTYLCTTLLSSSMGYGSVALFDTSQYLKPLLTENVKGETKTFQTDFTLLYIIAISLTLSFAVTSVVKSHRSLHKQIIFLSLTAEKLAYFALGIILWMMPVAVFSSILDSLQTHGLHKLTSLGWFVLYVNIPQLCYLFVLICFLKFGTRVSFRFAASAIKTLAKVALPSGSSAATILTNVETARTFPILAKYRNKGFIASILPFGATVNMDGTALFITIMCKIGADIQGIDVSYFDIIPYAVAYSCAAAAVPSASIVLITAIYTILGIDAAITVQILGLMIAVDWINDRIRTLINVSGDLTAILLSLNEKSPLQLAVKFLSKK